MTNIIIGNLQTCNATAFGGGGRRSGLPVTSSPFSALGTFCNCQCH